MAYINREKAFELITDFAGTSTTKSAYAAFWKSARALNKLPTADVVDVPCRCEKCKYCITHTCAITGIKTLFCDYEGITKPFVVEPTHFCGYGERRDTQC